MPRLAEFLTRHPDLEIEVVLDDRNIDLVQEGIDVGLRMGRLAELEPNRSAHREKGGMRLSDAGVFRSGR